MRGHGFLLPGPPPVQPGLLYGRNWTGGELRPVAGLDARLAEARKLGFDKVVVSSHQGLEPGMEPGNRSPGRQTKGLRVIPMDYISDWTATLRGVQPPSNESTPPT